MKRLVVIIVLFLGITNIQAQNIFVSGNIAVNTVWDGLLIDTVKVIGDVDLNDGVSLTITPGLVVDFTDDYYFNIDGNLYAVGTGADSIYFTTSDTSGFYNNTHHGWSGLRFHQEGSDSSRVEFASIQYGKADGSIPIVNSNYGGGIYLYQSNKVYITNVSVRNNFAAALGGGVYSFDSHPVGVTDNQIENSEFRNNVANDAGEHFTRTMTSRWHSITALFYTIQLLVFSHQGQEGRLPPIVQFRVRNQN